MITIDELANRIEPTETTIFLGSGVGKSSGAPLASELENYLISELGLSIQATDLATTAAVVELRMGRDVLVDAVRERLNGISPDDSLLKFANKDWQAIFTTNYDCLIEDAYNIVQRPLAVIRNNKDFSDLRRSSTTTDYFKLHGCMSIDVLDKPTSRLVLTEADYDRCADYREVLLDAFRINVAGGSTVIYGHSLKDRHLTDVLRAAVSAHRGQSEDHKIFLVGRQEDHELLSIQEGRGFTACIASFEDLMDAIDVSVRSEPHVPQAVLNKRLARTVRTIKSTGFGRPEVRRFFTGFTADYAEIEGGLTFSRTIADNIVNDLSGSSITPFHVITGPSGSGKVTAARQACLRLSKIVSHVWELNPLSSLEPVAWLDVARNLRATKQRAVLLVTDCADQLNNINALVPQLIDRGYTELSLILTSDSMQWSHRIKHRGLTSSGMTHRSTKLSGADIDEISEKYVTLPAIESNIESELLGKSAAQRRSHLRLELKSDAVTIFRYLFKYNQIDKEILHEYRRLCADSCSISQDAASVYQYAAAIETAGSVAERQLLHRIVHFDLHNIASLLERLEDAVVETEYEASVGAYLWRTRHRIIAGTLTDNIIRSAAEWRKIVRDVATAINPALRHELVLFRRMLNSRFARDLLGGKDERIELYEELLRKFPGERFLWHRLVSTYFAEGTLAEAQSTLDQAVDTVGLEPVLARYILKVKHAAALKGYDLATEEDRISDLRSALILADEYLRRFGDDKMLYRTWAEIAYDLVKLGDDTTSAQQILSRLESARDELLDPDFQSVCRNIYNKTRELLRSGV